MPNERHKHGGMDDRAEGNRAQDDRGGHDAHPSHAWRMKHQAASRSLSACGCKLCRYATARCAWAAAEKVTRRSLERIEPTCRIGRMIWSRLELRDDAEIGANERRPNFGDIS